MLHLVPSCLRRTASTSVAGGVGPPSSTSVYETRLGIASLTWSRTILGLSLLVDLSLSSSIAAIVQIRLWNFRKRKGSKQFRLSRHRVEIAWDLTRGKFSATGGPDPIAGFYVVVSVDREMLLIAGDRENEAYRKINAKKPKISSIPALISRRERVKLEKRGGRISYSTAARLGERERKISIDLEEEEEELGMCLKVDGESVLKVTRLRWSFRGSERVGVKGRYRIQVTWDLYNWFFRAKGKVESELGDAVFAFRFEREEEEEGYIGKSVYDYEGVGGYYGKSRDWSESSSESESESWGSSSVGGSTVMEWESPEEAELRKSEGFSLIVYGWKN